MKFSRIIIIKNIYWRNYFHEVINFSKQGFQKLNFWVFLKFSETVEKCHNFCPFEIQLQVKSWKTETKPNLGMSAIYIYV